MPIEGFESLPLKERVRLLLPYAQRDPEVAAELERVNQTLEANPLLGFEPHAAQRDFIQARTPVVAAFAGNRFGKSTALAVCALRECLPREVLPGVLRDTKRFDAPTQGWILVPTEDKIDDSFAPAFQKWCPKSEFLGGSWGKAFKGDTNLLRFKNGSTIQFKTYKQDASTLGGAGLHFVGYDEPPPRKHREECMWRLGDHAGYEMFAMTPLDTNTGYVRREIFKKRESPDITVVQGSVHENPTLDKATIARAIGSTTDIYRAAREFGIFVNVGGLIYPNFEKCVMDRPPERRWGAERRQLDRRVGDRRRPPTAWVEALTGRKRQRRVSRQRAQDRRQGPRWLDTQRSVVISIDPGIRNAAVVWVAFDRDNAATVFDELLLQDKTPRDYAKAIKQTNGRWGLKSFRGSATYVVDPAARQRGQINAETVQSALIKEDIPVLAGQNDVETGIGQARARMEHGRLRVSPECRGLRDEADDYAAKEPEEGRDDSHLEVVKSNDHRLDAMRYALMERFWDPVSEMSKAGQMLGWDPTQGTAPPASLVLGRRRSEHGPIGAY